MGKASCIMEWVSAIEYEGEGGRVAVRMGSIIEPRDSPNEPQARPPGGFPSAFNQSLAHRALH